MARIDNVLILLSPLEPALLSTHVAAGAALELKRGGASRADLATDPRFTHAPASPSTRWPVTEFDRAARALSTTLFGPVVGRSAVRDLSPALSDGRIVKPDLASLTTVGHIVAGLIPGRSNLSHTGCNLGMLFYVAVHATSPDRQPYSHVVLPDLTAEGRAGLASTLGGGLETGRLDGYGGIIDLGMMRRTMDRLRTASRATALPSSRMQ